MANRLPFFLTGANAKIILNNKSVAFATDISYSIDVRHATPRVLGRFETEVVQPLSYDVFGSLTIIKYARGMKKFVVNAPDSASQLGSGVGSFEPNGGGALAKALGLPSGGIYDSGAGDNFNPNRFFQSKMFDIEIRQIINERDGTSIMMRLRDCRFTGLDFRLTKRGLPLQTLSFIARYADDDTSVAMKSGVGQELS